MGPNTNINPNSGIKMKSITKLDFYSDCNITAICVYMIPDDKHLLFGTKNIFESPIFSNDLNNQYHIGYNPIIFMYSLIKWHEEDVFSQTIRVL